MNNIQYTIRNIPPAVDKVLRHRALKQGKSFNATVVEVLKKGTGVNNKPGKRHDLTWFFGSDGIGTDEEAAFVAQRKIDREKWSV